MLAEIIATTYYQALRDATPSFTLKAICTQILEDEDHHLDFQFGTLEKIRRTKSPLVRALSPLIHRVLLLGATTVVWLEHHSVYRAGGFTFRCFFRKSFATLRHGLYPERIPPATNPKNPTTIFQREMS